MEATAGRRPPDPVPPGDAELVARAAEGDSVAYGILYERHHAVVTRVVAARLGTQGDPADVVQEVFTTAWRKLPELREPERVRAWLLQIARRAAIDQGRRVRRQPVDLDGDETVDLVATADPGPEDLAELEDLARRIDSGLAGLSRRDATAISLATHFGFGPAEMADALGVTPGNAKVILHRARQRLRAAL